MKEVKNYSSGPAALVSASSENRVWGSVTRRAREHVHSKNEDVFCPGGLILVLALIGLARWVRLHAPTANRSGERDRRVLGARDGARPDGRGLSLSPAVRLCARLGRRARAGEGLHAGDAVPRAAGRRGRPAGWLVRATRGAASHACGARARDRRRGAADRPRRRRRGPSRPPGRAAAGARRDRVARAAAGPAHRRRAGSRVAVLLDGRLLQDPDRQQHLRHPRGGRPARRDERLPGPGERREAALLRHQHGRAAH